LVAARNFVGSDPVGSAVLRGRTVSTVYERDELWIAVLSPSGHVVLSGSDLADPIVGFSTNDFAEPDPDSPAYAYLAEISASLTAQESNGGVRHARWNRLLGGGTNLKLMAVDIESPSTVVIPPFLQSHYSQWQPYNDYAPVYESSTNNLDEYRGRCPCGCVATATAQGFRHFRWPARMDRVDSFNHSFTNASNVGMTFPIRFDGHLPIGWDSLEDEYACYASYCVTNYYPGGYSWWWEYDYDLRGSVPESVRYPIARLAMFADVLAHMSFKTSGSSANYRTVAANATDWYTPGTWVSANDARVPADIANGVPVQVTIPGHAVVGHGWATDGGNTYIYLNYGWGGHNDGYYNISGEIEEVYVGHYPRAKPQLDPLPKVCGPNVTLNWHFPDFYTNKLAGFSVAVSKTATTPTTFLDDFSAPDGVSTSDGIYVGVDGTYGYDGNLLYAASNTVGTYTFQGVRTLTSASVLTFKLLSFAALGTVYEVQASFDGGEWETICTPSLKTDWGSSGWSKERVYLGRHGGASVIFRIKKSRNSTRYFDAGRVLLDDFQVTDVLEQEPSAIYGVTAIERNFVLPRLDDGATYTFTVTPEIYGALVEGESSDPVSVMVAGLHRTPVPGEQAYHLENLSFSASDASGVWSYAYDSYGAVVDNSSVRGIFNCSITAKLPGILTTGSALSFEWCAENYYNTGVNTWTAVFVDESGSETQIGSNSISADVSMQRVDLSLAAFAGQSGRIRISYSRDDGSGWGDSRAVLSAPTITNVRVPTVPVVAWDTVTLTDLGAPAILSVSNVVDGVAVYPISEGFFRECKYGEITAFDVECSDHVENLNAYSSHLALIGERQVTTQRLGAHTFRVFVDASGISEEQSRSRMILTLEAIDVNGTRAYKDLSLRFSEEGEVPPVEPLEVTTNVLPPATSGVPYAVTLEAIGGVAPYTWFAATSAGYDDVRSAGSFSEVGAVTSQENDENSILLQLPFDFPFYGSTYSTVHVNPNGALTFNGVLTDSSSYSPSSATFQSTVMIAALWKDYIASIYVDDSSVDAVTIRWSGIYWNTSGSDNTVSFSVTLYADGTIRFQYGEGNVRGGIIGISSGNGIDYIEVPESLSYAMGNANDIVFTPWQLLPAEFSLSSYGVLSGTPTTAGVVSFTAYVTDGAGTQASKTVDFTINPAPLEVTTSVLPPATSGVPYAVTLEAVGGIAPYTWSAATSFGYDESRQVHSYSAVGTAQGWQQDDDYWELSLPFAFPFFGSSRQSVWVSSNGTLSFGDSRPGNAASSTMLAMNAMIAVLWNDLDTSSGDIYVDRAADHVTIRWDGIYHRSTPVSFSATLCVDGTIRLSYGPGNANGGLIGISSGRGELWSVDWIEINQYFNSSLANADDIVFAPKSSLPSGLSLSPAGVLSGALTAPGVESVAVFVTDDSGTRVGRTLSLTVEAPPATETSDTPVPVPYSWLDSYASSFSSPYDGSIQNYEELAQRPTGKRNADGSPVRLWQEYVAGTNPTNENDVFTAFIEMVDSCPVVRWKPDLNSNGIYNVRSYTISGKTNLTDTAWQTPTNSAHRFFRVNVNLP